MSSCFIESLCVRTVVFSLFLFSTLPDCFASDPTAASQQPRDPLAIELLQMDLDAAKSILNRHDLDDNDSISKTELERLGWEYDQLERFDLNRSGDLQYIEIAMKLGDKRIDDGIVQMDDTLARRYTAQYDANRDGKLSLDELQKNTFTDQLAAFDRDNDGELSSQELILGLAFERRFRDELGIKGCDQGGAMKLINRGDQNGDKRIDADELQAAGLADKVMKFDRNDDAELSVSELAECLASRRKDLGLTPSDQLRARAMLRQFDSDRDGAIVAAELPASILQSPIGQADSSGDGKISERELERHFGKVRRELGFDDDDAGRARILIQRNDVDGNQRLSKSEMTSSGADRNSPLSPTKLVGMDDNKDGEIEWRELARALSSAKRSQ
ncbi:hypothetical protein [Planctomycetes bacterium K23_9]|uniref:EF hand n=1 Tax=Stieleria marina TaxID=1930275 RepID=A0A517NPA7_9BACT|nr:EF hand [Planctomycetes bacterium K23_9]